MKKTIIIVVAVLLVAVGGVVGYLVFSKSNDDSRIYNEGDIIYYNPVSNEMDCSNYTESNSQSENKTGCMKWYVIDGNGSDINLILDHNTTNKVAWNTSGSNTGGPVTVNAKLKSDVSSWSNEAKNSARLITFEELKGMVSNYSSLSEQEFIDSYFIKAIESINSANENVKVSDYNTTKAYYQAHNDYTKKNYNDLILPDYMYEDILPKCADDGNCPTYGYWTSSPSAVNQNNNQAWGVVYFGMVFSDDSGVSRSDLLGVRPVITLAK